MHRIDSHSPLHVRFSVILWNSLTRSSDVEGHKQTVGEPQEWIRAMLATVGRGGDGQRIRDEILHIMHRNKVKEVRVRDTPMQKLLQIQFSYTGRMARGLASETAQQHHA